MSGWRFTTLSPTIYRVENHEASAVATLYLADKNILESHPLPDRPPGARVLMLQNLHASPPRKGAGTAMMERITQFADRRNLWIVLNCSSDSMSPEELVKYYERFGFEQPDPDDDSEVGANVALDEATRGSVRDVSAGLGTLFTAGGPSSTTWNDSRGPPIAATAKVVSSGSDGAAQASATVESKTKEAARGTFMQVSTGLYMHTATRPEPRGLAAWSRGRLLLGRGGDRLSRG